MISHSCRQIPLNATHCSFKAVHLVVNCDTVMPTFSFMLLCIGPVLKTHLLPLNDLFPPVTLQCGWLSIRIIISVNCWSSYLLCCKHTVQKFVICCHKSLIGSSSLLPWLQPKGDKNVERFSVKCPIYNLILLRSK